MSTALDLGSTLHVNARNDTRTQDAHTQADGVAEEESSQLQVHAPLALAEGNRHRRLRYEQPNALLTSPITPSSSMRTARSIESSVGYNAVVGSNVGYLQRSAREENIGFTDPDTISTRFLLIRNISRKVTLEVLQFAILRTIAAPLLNTTAGTVSSAPSTNQSTSSLAPTIDSIKGVLLRYQESHGIAILAFYDVRQAKSAQTLLSTPAAGALADCLGEEVEFGGKNGWFDCSFITSQDLAEMIGKSSFLAETQGSCFLTVDAVTKSSDATGTENAKREPSITTLINVLKAYGGLRSFGLASEGQQTPSRKVFCVEYYDVREANAAYPSLNGRVLFGMRLLTSGRDSQLLEHQVSSETAESESCIPFPGSQSEKSPGFEPAGQKAQIRERFSFIDTAGNARPRSIRDGHESLEGSINSAVTTGTSESPHYIYTSSPTSPSNGVHSLETHSRRASNHLFFDAKFPASDQHTPKRPRNVSFDSVAGTGRESGRQDDSTTPFRVRGKETCPPMEYCYLPTEFFPQPNYNGGPASPFPAAFPYGYPPHPSQLLPPGIFPGAPPSPLPYPYDYDPRALRGINTNMGNWTSDKTMIVPGMYGFPYPPPSLSSASEYWPGSPTSPQAYFQMTPSHAGVPSSGQPSVNNNSAPERNQLSLARIEDGQDTRTTVMIKNIPNEMTDQDLMAYIGSVCARKIDFYLRMDFTNGCNVGYAFVNFITVQDLLHFAKAKLGEKWNIFSSEKALQMSYANYQGKEALVEKFKNSCIMDESLAWQPKIFYTDGPEKGLPEPFPPPSHLRRKERSSYNREPL
ncbi:RNA recognition motif 2-domain-containing protein [Mycena sanguinolenta]|nr:RNA recognition motif 2-domain-containing protein [Mycena sanguinolenta]